MFDSLKLNNMRRAFNRCNAAYYYNLEFYSKSDWDFIRAFELQLSLDSRKCLVLIARIGM